MEDFLILTVHHLGHSQSERIVWLCEELEIPYELRRYNRDPSTRLAPPELRALHPTGAAPVVTDGDLVLAESGAIVEYILAKNGNGRLVPATHSPDFAPYLYWFHFANGNLQPAIMREGVLHWSGAPADNPMRRMAIERLARSTNLVETRLGEADYFAGSAFTAADIMIVFSLTTMRIFRPMELSPYPNILAYLHRIGMRPAYRRAMQKSDPDLTPLLT